MRRDGSEQVLCWDRRGGGVARFHSYLISLRDFRLLFSWAKSTYTSTFKKFLSPHPGQHLLICYDKLPNSLKIGGRTLTSRISTIISSRERAGSVGAESSAWAARRQWGGWRAWLRVCSSLTLAAGPLEDGWWSDMVGARREETQ